MKNFAVNALLVVVSIFIGIAIFEGICRWQESPRALQSALNQNMPDFFAFDPTFGWVNAANKDGDLLDKHHAHVHINSDGMRYREVGPKQRFRVAVIGDSFAWGLGVEADQRFTELVEQRLPVEMLNFGVPGYGPTQYYLELDHVLKFHPDVVLIVFSLFSDFQDTVNIVRQPYAAIESGQLVIKGQSVEHQALIKDFLRPWIYHSALARRLYRCVINRNLHWKDLPWKKLFSVDGLRSDSFRADPYGRPANEAFTVTEAVLRAIKERLNSEHIPMLILQARGLGDIKSDGASKRLNELATDLHISLVDPKDTSDADHLDRGGHWSVEGNKKAARALIPALQPYVMQNEKHK